MFFKLINLSKVTQSTSVVMAKTELKSANSCLRKGTGECW